MSTEFQFGIIKDVDGGGGFTAGVKGPNATKRYTENGWNGKITSYVYLTTI